MDRVYQISRLSMPKITAISSITGYNQCMSDEGTIKKILNGNITSIKPVLNKGDVNRVYVVTTDKETVVLRLNEAGELQRFKKEEWCLTKVSEIGIRSPQVLSTGVLDSIAYMVLNFIPGLNGEEIAENKSYIWHELGVYAKKIHSIQVQGFGERFINGRFSDFWKRYVRYNIESLNDDDKLLEMGVISKTDSEDLKHSFSVLLDRKFNFGLTHGDLSLANIIVEGEKITLIDWGSAELTVVPHYEIIGIFEDSLKENDPLFEDFLTGYGMTYEELDTTKQDIDSLVLLRSVDKLRWAIDKKPDMIGEFSDKVKGLVQS